MPAHPEHPDPVVLQDLPDYPVQMEMTVALVRQDLVELLEGRDRQDRLELQESRAQRDIGVTVVWPDRLVNRVFLEIRAKPVPQDHQALRVSRDHVAWLETGAGMVAMGQRVSGELMVSLEQLEHPVLLET